MRTRLAGSIALTVIGALLLLVGGVALYARQEIVDEQAFAQRASDTLEQDAVRHAVSRELAAEVSSGVVEAAAKLNGVAGSSDGGGAG